MDSSVNDYSQRLRKGQMLVESCHRADIAQFIETHHYSGSINGVMASHCFRLMHNGQMVGAMLYGELGMANAWRKYADNRAHVVELRRLCLIDETPKNAESYFIAQTLKWLKANTSVRVVVSYADPNHGHAGTIYKAANFSHIGMTSGGRVIEHNGKRYHDKAIRTTYNGKLKPFAQRLRDALADGTAHYVKQLPKHIYVMELK